MKTAAKGIIFSLWLVIAAFELLLSGPAASAKSPLGLQNCTWKIFSLAAQTSQPNPSQVTQPQQERAPPQVKEASDDVLAPNGAVVVTSDGSSVWGLNNFARGQTIQQGLGMNNLPWNYPVVDDFNWDTGVATSLKSLDLNAASYQDPTILANRLNTYIDSVVNFDGKTWGGVDIQPTMITGRQLQLAIPPDSITPAQQGVIDAATQNAAGKGINLIVTPVH